MTISLNQAGYRHALALIRAGKVEETSGWSFEAADGDAILGEPPDWKAYASWHLGRRAGAPEETKDAWAYPFGKGGRLYRPDPGWDFNPAKAAWGDRVAEARLGGFGQEVWRPLIAKTWKDFKGRPEKVPYEKMPAPLGETLEDYKRAGMSEAAARQRVREDFQKAIGGEARTFMDAAGEPLEVGRYLFDHLTLDGREAYLPLLPDVAKEPFEIWLSPEIGEKSGKVVFRRRYVKFYRDEQYRHVTVVADCRGTCAEGWNLVRSKRPNYGQNQRKGWLLYGK